ncbi:MAG: glutamine-hydrolyzing carbamoyl-phosphate synthase small subunit [Pseudomonadota bacterium]
MRPAVLALADGSVFRGLSIGVAGQSVGEVVFNTAMTGYQEILTDPSYARQLVTLTYPHIGNTGTNAEDVESSRVWAEGLIVRDVPPLASSWRSELSLPDYLLQEKVVGISNIDTRRLTRLIRASGAQAGCLVAAAERGDVIDEDAAVAAARDFPGLAGMDLAQAVTRDAVGTWQQGTWELGAGYVGHGDTGRYHVVAYDFGIKHNILRMLADRGCRLTVVPAKTAAADVLALEPDGVFLSNGPGDPEPCDYAIGAVEELLERGMPLFGICLGHQILALASGARTVKMPHGHHGANHPVQDVRDQQVIITSQNHGFAVDESSLPNCLETTHVSLFDRSLQGVRRTDRPAFGFQGHPEASPGPQDCGYLFDEFIGLMEAAR